MSYCSALPVVESESNILIEACLAGVRRDAGLDEEPVLPSLRSVLPPSAPVRRAAPAEIPSLAHASVGATTVRTRSVTRAVARSMRWPVLLCGFVGGTFAGAALMKSPAGETPALQLVAKVGRVQAARAWNASGLGR